MNTNSVWRKLVVDAKERNCFHNAVEDKKLAEAIEDAMLEFELLDESTLQFEKLSLKDKSQTIPTFPR